MSNFTLRLLSAVVLLTVVGVVTVFIRGVWLAAFMLAIGAVVTYEFTEALKQKSTELSYVSVSSLLLISFLSVYYFDLAFFIAVIFTVGLGLGFAGLVARTFNRVEKQENFVWLVIYLFWLVLPLGCLFYLISEPNGTLLLGYIIITVAVSDSAAYGFGKCLGKHTLMPSVSPGKTVEGALGGLVCAVLAGVFFCRFTGLLAWFPAFFLSLFLAVLAQVGDLAESKFKRVCGIKDSSALIPGHGGFLDRLDSYFFVSVGLSLFLLIFG